MDLSKTLMRNEQKRETEEVQKTIEDDRRMVIQVLNFFLYKLFFLQIKYFKFLWFIYLYNKYKLNKKINKVFYKI